MLITTGIFFGGMYGYQVFKNHMIKKFLAASSQAVDTISTVKAEYQNWQPNLKATGSVRAIQGVDITSEIAGLVREIYVIPGSQVKAGDLLVTLNKDQETAELEALRANAELAQITYERNKEQYDIKAISQAVLDANVADLKSKEAQVLAQEALIAKKTIVAPFDGKLGISEISPGQLITPGNKIITLQALESVFIDFSLPQQLLPEIHEGQTVKIKADPFPEEEFIGEITTINPKVDINTRNVKVQATIRNPKLKLLPGMFVEVIINTGSEKRYLTLPQTAISYNAYGEMVYTVNETNVDKSGQPVFIAKQCFVEVGEARGDQVAIKSGIKEGDIIVSSGQLKLKNGSQVLINNAIQPSTDPSPNLLDK